MMLTIRDLYLSFGGKPVLNGFSAVVEAGEIACLLGRSGCGKTTVLRSIAGFETPASGSISIKGQTVSAPGCHLPPHRRRIGMVFQDYALFPHLNVADNIAFGLHGFSAAQRKQRVGDLLNLIGLSECGGRYPHQLSGGQQQRVALARALAPKPDLILLDEPFSNLDAQMRTRLAKEVRQLLKQEQVCAVMVTHDRNEAFALADKIGVMISGSLKQWDTPEAVYNRPADEQTALLTGSGSILNGRIEDSLIQTAAGSLPHSGLSDASAVRVLLRPQHVRPDPTLPLLATIAECVFHGDAYVYTLQLDNGETLTAATAANVPPLSAGSRTGLDWDRQQAVVWPAQP